MKTAIYFLFGGIIVPVAWGMIAGTITGIMWAVPIAERHQSTEMIASAYAAMLAAGISGFLFGRLGR